MTRLIDADKLKEAINTWDKFACLPDCKLEPFRNLEHPEMFEPYVHLRDILNAIDNAPTVFSCNACKNMGNEQECVDCHDYSNYVHYEEIPQDDDLCETCRYGDTCGQSDKGVSFAKHSKCWKYGKEGGRQCRLKI